MTEDNTETQEQATVEKVEPAPANRLPTGLSILDRTLNGGIPKGSLVYFSAEPVTQPEDIPLRVHPAPEDVLFYHG